VLSKGFLFITGNSPMSSYHSISSRKQESIEKAGGSSQLGKRFIAPFC